MPIGSFNIILHIDNVFQNYLTRREQIEALNVLYSSLESKGLITEQGCPKNVQLFLSQTLILDYHTIKTRHLSSKVGHLGRYSMKSLKHKVRWRDRVGPIPKTGKKI